VDKADDSHRLTGWNAVKSRVEQLNLEMSDEQVKDATAKIKELADVRTQSMEDVDKILRIYHTAIQSGSLKVGQSEVLDQLLEKVSVSSFLPPFCFNRDVTSSENRERKVLTNSTCLSRKSMAQQPSDPELKPHKYFHDMRKRKPWIRVSERDQFVFCRLYKFKCRMHTIDAMFSGTVVPVQSILGHTGRKTTVSFLCLMLSCQVGRN